MSPATTQGFEASVVKYLKQQAGRAQNPWFRPMIFLPGEGTGPPWCCTSLCEEHVPEHLRRLVALPSRTSRKVCAREDCEESTTAASDDEDASVPGSASDAETAIAMQAAVAKFLRACGNPGQASPPGTRAPREGSC
mmetsp:Transcript_23004/g.72828  ORF Transcript_23004/g.72828 Transcript_23004/m.72828 type:complete len:137 (-) Transcript_23004:221-631(-)